MKRQLMPFAIIGFNFLLAMLFLQAPLTAAPSAQQASGQPEVVTETLPTTLVQPLQLTIHQQLPVSVTLGNAALSRTLPMTFEVSLNLVVTQSMTSTIASSVTLQVTNNQTVILPIVFTLRRQPAATVVVTPLQAAITTTVVTSAENDLPTLPPTPTATPTAAATQTPTPTVTATLTTTLTTTPTSLQSTVNITANLRAGPSTTFDIVGQASPGQQVRVVGISTDGLFFLLDDGQWIAVGLLDNVPTNPPLATDELIASLRTPTPTATANNAPSAPTPTATPTATRSLLPTTTPTPAVAQASVTNNANLRAGPGLEFATIGGTVAGQTITIVGRNQDGSWFQLDNGGWVAAFLVANPPNLADVPVVNPSQSTNGTSSTITTTTNLTTTTSLTATTPVTP